MSESLDILAVGILALGALAVVIPACLSAGIRSAATEPSPHSRLRVITLTHSMLDPGFAYWFTEDEATDV